ncbi:MAG: hypothetical protein HRU22_07295 [Gammaproteobacteria bacterium]|nr:hypothetical protein [Gammaproteobacteria bacterium]
MLQIRKVMLILLAIIFAVALLTKDVWYFGFTKHQTVNTLLEGGKYSSISVSKAIWHGDSILEDVYTISESLKSFNRNGAKNLVEVIEGIDIGSTTLPSEMESSAADYQKLFVFLILSKNTQDWWGSDIENTKQYLLNIVSRSAEKELSVAVQSYEFEIATRLLGKSKLFKVEEELLSLLYTDDLPHSYHASVCNALISYIDSEQVKESLIKRFLDVNFYAAIPAYNALSYVINDEEAKSLLRDRLALAIPNDEAILLKH